MGQQLSNNMQKPTATTTSLSCTREHPLGAHDENVAATTHTIANNFNKNVQSPTPATTVVNEMSALEETMETMEHLSVEHTLHQAGLLQPNSGSTTNSSSAGSASASGQHNNNNNRNNRPNALPIVFEEDTGEFQDVLVLEPDGTAKLPYRHGKKIEVSLETAQAMAAAAYYAR